MIAAAEPSVETAARPSLWKPLASPGFRVLLVVESAALAGGVAANLALAWATLQLTHSPALLGAVLLVASLPGATLSLLGGVAADRLPARMVLGLGSASRALGALLVAGFAATGHLELWMLFAAAAFLGIGGAFVMPAGRALLPGLLGDSLLEAGNSLLMAVTTVLQIAAPAIAGVGIALGGTPWAFGLAAACFAIAAAAGLLVPARQQLGSAGEPVLRAIRAGLSFVWHDGALRTILLIGGVLNFCINGPFEVGLTTVARQRLGGPAALGAVEASFALGMLAGTIAVGVFGRVRRLGVALVVVGCLIAVVITGFGFARNLAEATALGVVGGAGAGYISVLGSTWLQRRTPSEMLGRVMSVSIASSLGLAPLSYAIAGALGQLGPEVLFVTAGASVAVVTAMAALSREIRNA